jgi:hypothetical protein
VKAMRRAVDARGLRVPTYAAGLVAVAVSGLLLLTGRPALAVPVTALSALLLWLAGLIYFPFGEGAHYRRVSRAIEDANIAARHVQGARSPGASQNAGAAERERMARRLRRLRPPRTMAAEHAELVSLAERYAAVTSAHGPAGSAAGEDRGADEPQAADAASAGEALRLEMRELLEGWYRRVLRTWSGTGDG